MVEAEVREGKTEEGKSGPGSSHTQSNTAPHSRANLVVNSERSAKSETAGNVRSIRLNTVCESMQKKSFEPDSNQRPMDDHTHHYSPPLYQLSYRRMADSVLEM